MVRRTQTRRNRKQHAGGLGNTLRRTFGFAPKQVVPVPAPIQAQAGPGQVQLPWYKRIFQRTQKASKPVETNYTFKPMNQNILNTYIQPGTEKALSYLYQRLQNPRGPLDTSKIILTPEEHSVLRQRFLQAIYNPQTGQFSMSKSINQILEEIYGRPNEEIREEFREWDPVHHTLDRFLNFLLRTDTEMKYFYDASAKCTPSDLEAQRNTIRTFRDDGCVTVGMSIHNHLIESPVATVPLFIILQASFFHPIQKSRYNVNNQSANVNANNASLTIPLYRIPKASFIKGAFANKGLKCIHPILGYMLQKQVPQLWTQSYFADYSFVNKKRYFKSQQLEDAVRIVTLTLQYYAAVRRYAYTKSHTLTSQVYEVDPRTIARELRTIDQSVPNYTVIATHNTTRAPQGYIIYKEDIQRDLEQNQLWAIGKVVIKSLQDKQLNTILPVTGSQQFPWLQQQGTRESYQFLMAVPEEARARAEAERLASFAPGVGAPEGLVPFGEEEAEAEALAEAEEVVPGQGANIRSAQRNLQALLEGRHLGPSPVPAPRPPAGTRRNNRSWIHRNVSAFNQVRQYSADPRVANIRRRLIALNGQPQSTTNNGRLALNRRRTTLRQQLRNAINTARREQTATRF